MPMNFNVVLLLFVVAVSVATAGPLHPKKTQYDEQLSKRLLYLSAGAYAPTPDKCLKEGLPGAQQWAVTASHNETCDMFSNLCAFYTLVSDSHHVIYVVFRGTKGKKQLFFEGWQTFQPGANFFDIGKINKYFFRAHNALWDNILPVLSNNKYKDYEVIFTGHSLGGALASIGALRTVLEGIRRSDQVKLYTFGQPRVGDIRMAHKHDELVPHSFRVVHRLDIIPHFAACAKDKLDPRVDKTSDSVPCDPNAIGIAYHHGTEIWYPNGMGNDAKYYECVGTPKNEDFDCSDSLSFELSKYDTYISDHRHYFEHKVPSWGKLGCSATKTEEESVSIDAAIATPLDAENKPHSSSGGSSFAQAAQAVGRLLKGLHNRR